MHRDHELSVAQIGKTLGTSRATVYRYHASGQRANTGNPVARGRPYALGKMT